VSGRHTYKKEEGWNTDVFSAKVSPNINAQHPLPLLKAKARLICTSHALHDASWPMLLSAVKGICLGA